MYKKLNDLRFVIGLFFSIVSLILLGNMLLNRNTTGGLNIYTGVSFLIFGLCMMFINRKNNEC